MTAWLRAQALLVIAVVAFAFLWQCYDEAFAAGAPGPKGGKFEVTCKFSNHRQVDPIVSPGSPMSAHLHAFFANRNVTENSTADSLRGGSTTCKVLDDTAGYWIPAAYRTDTGALLTPTKIFAYYFGLPGRVTEAPPAGLKMVAGNGHATAPQGKNIISWSCGNGGHSHSPVKAEPYNCLTEPNVVSQGVVAIVKFPWCWNGTGLEPTDVAYGDFTTGACPAGFPHLMPQLQEHVHYGNSTSSPGWQRGDLMTLSSGPTYTLHGDWINSWIQSRLADENARCTAVNRDCGFLQR